MMRWLVSGGAAVAILAAAAVAVMVAGAAWRVTDARSGDPGGRVLHQLQPAVAALPAEARIVYRHDVEPRWDSCDGRPGTFGWNDVVVQVHFTTGQSGNALISHADATLASLGWTLVSTGANGVQAEWSRTLDNATTARAQLAPDWDGGPWTLFVLAPRVGQRSSGC